MFNFCVLTDLSLQSIFVLYILLMSARNEGSFFRMYRLYVFINLACLNMQIFAFSFSQEMMLMKGIFYVDQLSLIMKMVATVFITAVLLILTRVVDVSSSPLRFMKFLSLIQLMMSLLLMSQHFLIGILCLTGISICLYVLILGDYEHPLSNEAALKYMLQSGMAVSIGLLGLSFMYGSVGSLLGTEMRIEIASQKSHIYLLMGACLFWLSMLVNLGKAPFHLWMVDVFQVASLPTVLLNSIVTKLGVLSLIFLLIRTVGWSQPESSLQVFIKGMSIVSILWGGAVALRQMHLMRFLAYSSVVQLGFICMGLLEPDWRGFDISLHYFFLYSIAFMGIIIVLVRVRKTWEHVEYLPDLSGLHKSMPFLAFSLSICVLSLAGLPPFGGFFVKLFVIQSLLRIEDYTSVFFVMIGVVLSVAYYLNFIRIIYFESPRRPMVKHELSLKDSFSLDLILILIMILLCFYALLSKFTHEPLLQALSPYKD